MIDQVRLLKKIKIIAAALAVLMLISLTDSAVPISNFGTLYNRKELFGHFSKETNL